MKHLITTYVFLMLLLLFSCKSQKDVSSSFINQSRGESLVSVVDSTQTHLETSFKVDSARQEDSLEYTKTTEFGNDNNVESITERYIILFSKLDFKSQLGEIMREDFRYNHSVAHSDTVSTVMQELSKEKTDSRLVQGFEWLYITAGAMIVIVLMAFYIKKNILV